MYGNSGKDLLLVLKWREKLLQYLLNICTFSRHWTPPQITLTTRFYWTESKLSNSYWIILNFQIYIKLTKRWDNNLSLSFGTFPISKISNFQNCQNSLSNKSNSGPSIQAAWAAAFIIYHGMNNWTAYCCLQLQKQHLVNFVSGFWFMALNLARSSCVSKTQRNHHWVLVN